MAAKKNAPYPGTQAVSRAMALLAIFSDEQPEWSLARLTEAVNLNRTTVYRLLTVLEHFELVTRNPASEQYRLGVGLITLGGRALRANPLRAISRLELEGLAAASGETATLEILMGHEMLIIEEVGGERLLRGGPSIGSRWPAFATSTGQAIMAYLPEPELAAILAAPRPALTPHTITGVDSLRQRLQTIREQGYAVVSEALELGFVAVGAAIRDVDGRPIAAVSLGGPTLRLTEARFPEIYALVRLVADRISRRLGHQPSVK